MPRQLPDSKTLILKVIQTFQFEAYRNKPVAGFSNPLQRATLTLGLSRKCIDRIKKTESQNKTQIYMTKYKKRSQTYNKYTYGL